MGGSLLFELSSSDEEESELDYSSFRLFCLLNFQGRMFNFLMELLYAQFQKSSFQFVGPPNAFFPSPKLSSLLLICTQSVDPCCFFPSPFPYFHPIFIIIFLAISLSTRMFDTPELWSILSLYLLAINNQLIIKQKILQVTQLTVTLIICWLLILWAQLIILGQFMTDKI